MSDRLLMSRARRAGRRVQRGRLGGSRAGGVPRELIQRVGDNGRVDAVRGGARPGRGVVVCLIPVLLGGWGGAIIPYRSPRTGSRLRLGEQQRETARRARIVVRNALLEPGAEAREMKQVAAGQPLGRRHALLADGALVVKLIQLLTRGVRKSLPEVARGCAVVDVRLDAVPQARRKGLDVQKQNRVNQLERHAVQPPDVGEVQKRQREGQGVRDKVRVVQQRAAPLAHLVRRVQAPEFGQVQSVANQGLNQVHLDQHHLEHQQQLLGKPCVLVDVATSKPPPGDAQEKQHQQRGVAHVGGGRGRRGGGEPVAAVADQPSEYLEKAERRKPHGPQENLQDVRLHHRAHKHNLEHDVVHQPLHCLARLHRRQAPEKRHLCHQREKGKQAEGAVKHQQHSHFGAHEMKHHALPHQALRVHVVQGRAAL
mmetsp:Transcript_30527/g.58785  ORF Transcript_30527/g.58785 Transcript_30527/m.58785 type:complete len:426 (-) Transcript_30527:642-1919(-)